MALQKNNAQEKAINIIDGQIIMIACPGSGKTTTLIRRIHNMIDQGVNPENILMITFTKSAAKEMGARYRQKFGTNPGITFCTIHALCFAILKKFGGYTSDNLLKGGEEMDFFYNALRYENRINDKDAFIGDLITDITVIKNNRIKASSYAQKCCDDNAEFVQLYEAYEQYKEDNQKIDFDDMLEKALELMEQNEECLSWLRDRYRYIQVDEYQDTNCLQRDIVYLLAGKNGNLAVVGDDDQSIYSFRGSKPEIMMNFKVNYPNATEIYMDTNYRCASSIVKSAANLINKNKVRFKKDFVAAQEKEGVVDIVCVSSRQKQLMEVALNVNKLIKSGENPSDIAILYRMNSQAMDIADLFMKLSIPFVSNEPIESRYDHWIYRDVLSYHNLAIGKGSNADIARTINHPNRYLFGNKYTKCGLDKSRMLSAAYADNKEAWKKKKTVDNIDNYFRLIEVLKNASPVGTMLRMATYGYKDYLKEYAEFRNIDVADLLSIWNSYINDAKEKEDDWDKWSRYIVNYNRFLSEIQSKKEGVVLSTLHRSKGLEWKHVFIVDCVYGVCPFKKAKTAAEIEEERRLFYVGMTRAKENLFLYYYEAKNGEMVFPSPFLP